MNDELVKIRYDDLEGQVFGLWTIGTKAPSRGDNTYWNATCSCGFKKEVSKSNLMQKKSQSCKNCRKIRWADASLTDVYPEGENNPRYKGLKELSGRYWGTVQRRAKVHNKEFSITKEYAYDLYLKQNRKCKLSGVDITLTASQNNKDENFNTASLDRIDSSKGYVEGNVQWLHKKVNTMKWDLSQNEFIQFCKLIVEANQ